MTTTNYNENTPSPNFWRRIDSAIRGVANGITFGGADWLAGKMDTLVFGGTDEQNIADERAETRQRHAEGYEEEIGELVGAAAGIGKFFSAAGLLFQSARLAGTGAALQIPMVAGAAGARVAIGAAFWATKTSLRTVKWAGITAGLTWGTAEALDVINTNWRSYHGGEPPPALVRAGKLAGLAWGKEKAVAGWVWDNAIVPSEAAVSRFMEAWAGDASNGPSSGPLPSASPPLPAPRNGGSPSEIAETVSANRNRAKILFGIDRSDLTSGAKDIIDEYAAEIKNTSTAIKIIVAGHASTTGPEFHNLALSARRAEAVRAELVRCGVREQLLDVEADGSRRELPVFTGPQVENAQNRSVTLAIVRRNQAPSG